MAAAIWDAVDADIITVGVEDDIAGGDKSTSIPSIAKKPPYEAASRLQ